MYIILVYTIKYNIIVIQPFLSAKSFIHLPYFSYIDRPVPDTIIIYTNIRQNF